jgi:hypothetical protein
VGLEPVAPAGGDALAHEHSGGGDFVVEPPSGRLLPIEVKATAQPGWGDVAGLRSFLEEYEDLVLGGLVLHGGTSSYRLSPKLVAAPWWKIL